MHIRDLTRAEQHSAAFRELLWHAAELSDDQLDVIRDTELPELRVVGAFQFDELIGFLAHTQPAGGALITIEYIAASARLRGTGVGRALVNHVRFEHPGHDLRAETDDDAIAFYRALGFTDAPAPPDPRWPGRARYICTLPATA